MDRIAIVGGGLGGLALLAGMVRAAIDQDKTDISITVFEPNFIGPGLAYDTHAPDAFKLNHELDFMGSVNVRLRQLDAKDFYKWVRQHRSVLSPLYPGYDLTNPKEYVPRSLYGRYLQVRYEELRSYADDYGMYVHESHLRIDDISKTDSGFVLTADGEQYPFDTVALTTGNYFNLLDPELSKSGRCFRPGGYRQYVSDMVADGSVMLIAGSALFAYDAALYALESGKYQKVIMASRRAMLRKVRGHVEAYERKYLTIPMLEVAAGGKNKPFRLKDVLELTKREVEHASGHAIVWKDGYSPDEIVKMLSSDLQEARSGKTQHWRSILASISDAERHQIYARLHDEDKSLFLTQYASLYNLFLAPMPSTNAEKLQRYLKDGRIELVNGMRSATYAFREGKFELHYAQQADGAPPLFGEPAGRFKTKVYPIKADVYIDARGVGRDISHVPLYKRLIARGLAVPNQFGGIHIDLPSYTVLDTSNAPVSGLYAIGQMACGETAISHNSIHMSRLGIEIGTNIIADVRRSQGLYSMREHRDIKASQT